MGGAASVFRHPVSHPPSPSPGACCKNTGLRRVSPRGGRVPLGWAQQPRSPADWTIIGRIIGALRRSAFPAGSCHWQRSNSNVCVLRAPAPVQRRATRLIQISVLEFLGLPVLARFVSDSIHRAPPLPAASTIRTSPYSPHAQHPHHALTTSSTRDVRAVTQYVHVHTRLGYISQTVSHYYQNHGPITPATERPLECESDWCHWVIPQVVYTAGRLQEKPIRRRISRARTLLRVLDISSNLHNEPVVLLQRTL